MSERDGGTAFPVEGYQSTEFGANVVKSAGMSLRDYFAAHALNSLYLNTLLNDNAKEAAEMATMAYQIADAMLAEREK